MDADLRYISALTSNLGRMLRASTVLISVGPLVRRPRRFIPILVECAREDVANEELAKVR